MCLLQLDSSKALQSKVMIWRLKCFSVTSLENFLILQSPQQIGYDF